MIAGKTAFAADTIPDGVKFFNNVMGPVANSQNANTTYIARNNVPLSDGDGPGPSHLPNEWGETRYGTYTGDGTQSRYLSALGSPSEVIIKGEDGTIYDFNKAFGKGFKHNAPTGEISIGPYGFKIGDNGADADPNTEGKTYTYRAKFD